MSDLSLRAIPALTLMFLVQFLNLSNLRPQTPDFFPKNYEVIHTTRIVHLDGVSVGANPVRERDLITLKTPNAVSSGLVGSFGLALLSDS